MNYDTSSAEAVIEIYRILNKHKDWCPGVKIIKDHEGDAVWVGALMYSIYSRYLETVPDSEQHEFESSVKEVLKVAFEHGMEYTDSLKDNN